MTSRGVQRVITSLPAREGGIGEPDFAWKVAVAIVEKQDGLVLPTRPSCRWLRAAVALLSNWRGCGHLPDVRVVAEARRMNFDPAASVRIHALLSAKDATIPSVARSFEVGEEVVEAYECLFFSSPRSGPGDASNNKNGAGGCRQISFGREMLGETRPLLLDFARTATVAEVEAYLAAEDVAPSVAGEAAAALQSKALASALAWVGSGQSKEKLTPLVKLGLEIAGRTEVEVPVRPLAGSNSGKAIREQLHHFASRIRRSFEDEGETMERGERGEGAP